MAEGYFGKYSGIVKDNRDDQKLGQVAVSVPALFPPNELVIARAALPYGFYFVPENEAKVWVEFEGGDSTLALWTGLQCVPGDWPTDGQVKPPQRRVIQTAAGHRIVFRDKQGEEAIEITDGVNGHVITLDQNGITVKQGQTNTTTLAFASGGVTLDCESDVTLKAKGAFTIEAGGEIKVTGKQGVTVEATAQLTAKGNPIHLNP
ncbi:MAG: hypothetical protein AUI36_01615 [Cyanobacteria bacterium 13_1_40CM_2_61_4]|nr:MAG: hypothetical protein AUI36_01615 [Cyanobacteria bacterium 13_1_40CM_2_61_4]